MNTIIPDVPIKPIKRSLWDRVSVVWLVPLLALVVALSVAWQSYSSRGPLIEIVFDSATGVIEKETALRFRDVIVGTVEDLRFTPGLDQVVVEVRLSPDIAPYVDAQSEFWIVRPVVTTRGVTGLDTVLSGVYIRGAWDDEVTELMYSFEGLDEAPLLAGGQAGLHIMVRSSDGSLTGNTPILFKSVEVGRIGVAEVSADGFAVEAEAVIYAPYDNFVTTATRFWDTSGFSFSVGTGGASVDFESLASLIAGGVTFETLVSGAPLARDGDEFVVYSDSRAAHESVFRQADGISFNVIAVFEGNVAGLVIGSAVELNGLRIGEVRSLNGVAIELSSGETQVNLQTVLSIQPSRLGMEGSNNTEDALQFLAEQVEEGLRARLVTGSILTGGLKVQLITVADAELASMDLTTEPFPSIPVTDSVISDVATTAQGTLDRIDNLPIEELMQSSIDFLQTASILVGSQETQAVPGDISALLAELRAVVGSDDVQALPQQLGSLMTELDGIVGQVSVILSAVEEQDIIERIGVAVDSATALSNSLDTTLEGVPALIEEITILANRAGQLELEQLVQEITALSGNASALLGGEAAQDMPGQINQTLAGLQTTLAEVNALAAEMNATDATTRLLDAVDAATTAAGTVESSFHGVPELVARLNAIAADAENLELDALIAQLTDLLGSADTLLASGDTQALPGALNGALDELGAVMAELRDGGAVENTNAALLSARRAADAVAAATADLPALLARANTLIGQANTTLSGFEDTSPAIRDARDALREVQEAADAVQSLARALERSPLLRR